MIVRLEAMTTQFTELQTHWLPIAPLLSLRTQEEYDAAVERLNALLDEIGTNEAHPLYSLLDTLGTLVHTYEAEHNALSGAKGPEVLRYLMEENSVSATDLPEVGPPDLLKRYLDGKAEFSIEQVRSLARRFHVSPAAFI
jgi:HTH-type transcriptional regulator / antitoxin HigA